MGPCYAVQIEFLRSLTQLCMHTCMNECLCVFCFQPQKVNLKPFLLDQRKPKLKRRLLPWHTAQQAGDVPRPPKSYFVSFPLKYRQAKWSVFGQMLWKWSVTYKIKKKEYLRDYDDCYSNAPFGHCPSSFDHPFAGSESSISDGLFRVQPKTQNPWINEAMHVSHCAVRPQTARQSMMLLLFLAKVDFVVYWIWHEPLYENFKGTI